jgi:hypothetical protein
LSVAVVIGQPVFTIFSALAAREPAIPRARVPAVRNGGVSYGNETVFILTLSEQANPNARTCTDKNP